MFAHLRKKAYKTLIASRIYPFTDKTCLVGKRIKRTLQQNSTHKIFDFKNKMPNLPDMRELDAIQKALHQREAALAASEEANRKARAALEQDKRAFDRVLQMSRSPNAGENLSSVPGSTDGRETVKKYVIGAILELNPGNRAFSTTEVIAFLEALPRERGPFDIEKNRANLSSYMVNDLVDDGLLMIVEKGRGRRATRLKLKDPNP